VSCGQSDHENYGIGQPFIFIAAIFVARARTGAHGRARARKNDFRIVKAVRCTMTSKVFIKDYLRGPYTLIDAYGKETIVKEPVAPRKWLPGSAIDAEGRVVYEKHAAIVGIVDYLNRAGQGFNTRGTPLYLFYPLDRGFPPFLVASKERCTSNMIACVAFEHWNDRWARGGIVRRLGAVGDHIAERCALMMRAGFQPPCEDLSPSTSYSMSCYDDRAWNRCFNIDPVGCVDVDDVFAWRALPAGGHEFAIAIADVSAWVAEGDACDADARTRGTSVYEEGTVLTPMLPRIISERAASLRADGIARPCLALCWTVGADGAASSARWERLALVVDHAYTYESFCEEKADKETLYELLEAVGATRRAEIKDAHDAVAAAMILYNRIAGELLVRSGRGGLLRAHEGGATPYADLAASTGVQELRWLGSAAGRYVVAATGAARHVGLGLDAYAHASSPLRRYADLVNQRAIKAILFETQIPCADPELPTWLNARCAAAAALERDLWFAAHVKTDTISSAVGIVLRIRTTDARKLLTVYVPEWRRKLRCVGEAHVGNRVGVRVFCDNRATRWDDRIVGSAELFEALHDEMTIADGR
jgi:exoribonuclease R